MKNVLWKLRKILPALLFFISCWVFIVHAINNDFFYNKYSINESDNTLTDSDWNNLMGDLDNLVPDGTVLAFLSDKCPTGWNDFTIANDWRFLMWADSDIGNRWWKSSITLSVSQIPAHSHYIRFWKSVNKYWDDANWRPVAVDWDSGEHPISDTGTWYSLFDIAATGSWINTVKTQRVWSGSPIDILNPYVKIHYCIRWSESSVKATVHLSCNKNYCTIPQQNITAPIGSSISFSDISWWRSVKIWNKSAPVYSSLFNSQCFSFTWSNSCGDALTDNCSIIGNFKAKNMNISYQHVTSECSNWNTASCDYKCDHERAKEIENVCGGKYGTDYTIGQCKYNPSWGYMCNCTLYPIS